MSRFLVLLTSLLTALCLGLSGTASADPAPPADPTPTPTPAPAPVGPLRLLITGDSITQGFHGDYTWRYRLDKEIDRQRALRPGMRDIDLVGSRRAPYASGGWTGATYADPHFDQDHFAFAGTTLVQQSGWIAHEVATQHPDLIVLASGVNDLRRGSTPVQTRDHLLTWLRAVRSADPDVDIILSPVLAAQNPSLPHLPADIVAYDAMLPRVVAEQSTPTSTLTLADTTFGWKVDAFTVENLHPNPTGETHIAQRIAETLHLLGLLPLTPMVFRAEPWLRTERATVHLRDNRAYLTWPDHVLSGAKVFVRRVGGTSTISRTAYPGGHYSLGGLRYGSTYDFRLRLVRGRMTGPWGPATRVRVVRPVRPAPVASVLVNAGGVRWTASPRATSYVVATRRVHRTAWVTRRTTGLRMLERGVQRAKVVAVNGGGRSAARLGKR